MPARGYWPQLDGVRAFAIGIVVAYHLGYLGGGWLGVDIFFVLSGYLITTILLAAPLSGRGLARFWGRRAKRLLPAVLLLLAVLAIYCWAGGPGVVPAQVRGPAIWTLFYGANWEEIFNGAGYFAAYTSPNPLLHTWSLAIEEQYYVVWPLLLGGLTLLLARRSSLTDTQRRRQLAMLTAALGVLSAVWMGFAAHFYGINRAYLGTDSRAWELLLGGALAMLLPAPAEEAARSSSSAEGVPIPDGAVWAAGASPAGGSSVAAPSAAGASPASGSPVAAPSAAGASPASGSSVAAPSAARQTRLWAILAVVGVAGVAAGVSLATGPPNWVWDGGLVAIAAGVGLVIVAALRAPDSPVGRVLAFGPLRWIGKLSYSLYLWHWLVIVLLSTDTTELRGWVLLVVRLVTMTVASAASYYLVEQPLRWADWGRIARAVRVPAPSFAVFAITVAAALIVFGTVGPAKAGSAQVTLPDPVGPVDGGSLTSVPPGSTANPYRVWIIGDSVMDDASPGVTAALQATGAVSVVANTAFPGWGLTVDTGWPGDAEGTIRSTHPQIVIGTWSWDDNEAYTSPAAYLKRLESAIRAVLAPANGVEAFVLVQFPQVGPPTSILDAGKRQAAWVREVETQNAWDRLARQAVAAFPGRALYLTSSQLFAPGGRFFTWFRTANGRWVRARKLDNTHFCPYGAAEFGALITAELTPILHLPAPTPGWEFDPWIHDPRYNDPAGACPNDHPPLGYNGIPVPTG